ncbi:MAG TPA: hypothetical protein VL944_00250 [Candidatus Acidoferrum sp.]|nr:hypothetical protein [Candidatus Acidoferrum sp.]
MAEVLDCSHKNITRRLMSAELKYAREYPKDPIERLVAAEGALRRFEERGGLSKKAAKEIERGPWVSRRKKKGLKIVEAAREEFDAFREKLVVDRIVGRVEGVDAVLTYGTLDMIAKRNRFDHQSRLLPALRTGDPQTARAKSKERSMA